MFINVCIDVCVYIYIYIYTYIYIYIHTHTHAKTTRPSRRGQTADRAAVRFPFSYYY